MAEDVSLPNGVTLADNEPQNIEEDVDAILVDLGRVYAIEVGEDVGNPVYIETRYVALADKEGPAPEHIQKLHGKEKVDESALFVSNEDGEIGIGIERIDEGGTLQDAAHALENYL